MFHGYWNLGLKARRSAYRCLRRVAGGRGTSAGVTARRRWPRLFPRPPRRRSRRPWRGRARPAAALV